MFYSVVVGIPYFITFYQSKSFKYRKCAEKHYKKIIDLFLSSGLSINTAFRFTKIVFSLNKNPDMSLFSLMSEILNYVR